MIGRFRRFSQLLAETEHFCGRGQKKVDRSLELRDFGKLPEKDLTEFFEDKYLNDGKLVIPPGLYRKMFGPLNDPSLGVPKLLEIEFVHAGNKVSVLLPENISVTLPFPYSVTSENMT